MNAFQRFWSVRSRRNKLRKARRIIIGAGPTVQDGWAASDIDILDVRERGDFLRYWPPSSLHCILAEHVWEHLSDAEGTAALLNCREFLAKGGTLRLAVPDGYHPDPDYIEWVRPGGSGPGAQDHKMLYTFETLSQLVAYAGLVPQRLEYWDECGTFHSTHIDPSKGLVLRSFANDPRNSDGMPHFTSLIIDAVRE